MNDPDKALKAFEATAANLEKLQSLWDQLVKLIPGGPAFGAPDDYDDLARTFKDILAEMPATDGHKLELLVLNYNEIGQARLDALEVGKIGADVAVDEWAYAQGKALDEYRYRLNKQRRLTIRSIVRAKVAEVTALISQMSDIDLEDRKVSEPKELQEWPVLHRLVSEIGTLLGDSTKKPKRWFDLFRHLKFGMKHDLRDIKDHDWPAIMDDLEQSCILMTNPFQLRLRIYLIWKSIAGVKRLQQSSPGRTLQQRILRRLIYNLIANSSGYENPTWLMKTNAPDRGRDLSVYRVFEDSLSGTRRDRVIIQCKHWVSRNVGISDLTELISQMKLWEPPRVDVHVVATSGRFTADSVAFVEKHNQSDTSLSIELWPDSHLEMLLSMRPALIAEYGLR